MKRTWVISTGPKDNLFVFSMAEASAIDRIRGWRNLSNVHVAFPPSVIVPLVSIIWNMKIVIVYYFRYKPLLKFHIM